jgi:hypothetical protein
MAARGAAVARGTPSVAVRSEVSAGRRNLVSVYLAASGDPSNGRRVVVMRE